MIEPGTPLEIEHNGETFQSVVLTRSEQRGLTKLVQQVSTLDETIDSIDGLYDLIDEIVAICLPGISETDSDRLEIPDVVQIAGEVLARHIAGIDTKKKSELPPSSVPVCSVADVAGDVWTDGTA